MRKKIAEKHWKYLRKIQPEMLAALCARINRQAMDLLQSGALSELEKYQRLYKHVRDCDKVVADCFDDWRRSNMLLKVASLRHEDLLTDEHLGHLSDETRELVEKIQSIARRDAVD